MIELTEADRELCQPELDVRRVSAVAKRYDLPIQSAVFILREYDNAVCDDPLGHEHFRMVAEHLEVSEDLVGHVVTDYMEAAMPAGAGKTSLS